eukprot:5364174-Pleurochrysis_carterae.AAC.2
MLEVRTDIAKVGTCQRPVPRAAADLGEWEKCLWFQNYAAVLQVALFTTLSTETLEKARTHALPRTRAQSHTRNRRLWRAIAVCLCLRHSTLAC